MTVKIGMERRKFKRVHTNFNVYIDLLEKSEIPMEMDVGKTANISAVGVMINHNKFIDVGKMVLLTFLCPNTFDILKVYAKTVRVEVNKDNTYSIGFEFLNLAESDIKRLNYFLTYDNKNA